MAGRPSGVIPVWGSDASYPAGSDPWAGSATKVDPGATKVARGWVPGERPPPQWENWFWNKISQHIQSQDAIEVQNWTPDVLILSSLDTNQGPTQMAYDPERGWIWAVGGVSSVGSVLASHDGRTWIDLSATLDSSPTPYILSGIAFASTGRGFACSAYGSSGRIYDIQGDVLGITEFTGFDVSGSNGHYGILRAEEEELFLLFGAASFDHPGAWTIDDSGTVTALTLPGAASLTGVSKLAAVTVAGPHIILADILGTWHQWDAPTLTGSWTHRGAVSFLSAPRALTFSEEEGIFMVTCSSGQTYVSSDAQNWTLKGVAGATFLPYCLAGFGAIWVAAVTINSVNQGAQQALMYTVNQGQSWFSIPYPFDRGISPGCMARVNDRFAMVSSAGRFAASWRAR